jgi:hypothetical protein
MAEPGQTGRRTDQRAKATGASRIIQVAGDIYVGAGSALRAVASLPAGPARLVGRDDEVALLLDLLAPHGVDPRPVVVSAVAGLPGVGKTALALDVAHRAAVECGWFPGGVLFLDLRGYDPDAQVSGEHAIGRLIRALGVRDADLPSTLSEQIDLYRSMLFDLADHGRRVLLVADNVSDPMQVRELIPARSEHRMLITSRNTLVGLSARLVDVNELGPEAGAALITDALIRGRPDDRRPDTEPQALAKLIQQCGGLPLALEILAEVLIADPGLPLADLAREMADERGRLTDDGARLASVRAAFDLSYRRLPTAEARLFRLLPVNPGPEISGEAAAVLADEPLDKARRLLAALAQVHLVKEQPVGDNRWRMHDLIRLYASDLGERAAETDGRIAALGRLLTYYQVAAHDANQWLNAPPSQSTQNRFRDLDQALSWLDSERINVVAAIGLIVDNSRKADAVELAADMASYLNWRRYFYEAILTGQTALTAARQIGDRHGEGKALTSLVLQSRFSGGWPCCRCG